MDGNLKKKIKKIEKKFEIKIIFACEWGSRAYGKLIKYICGVIYVFLIYY